MIKILLLKTVTLPNGDEFLRNDLKWPAVGSGGVTVASKRLAVQSQSLAILFTVNFIENAKIKIRRLDLDLF